MYFKFKAPISGGYGDSFENAIVIEMDNGDLGVDMEYKILKMIHSLGGNSWKLDHQEMIKKNGKVYDKLSIVLENNPGFFHNYYFDITRFYGK
jgi:hypothetical protein